MVADLFHYGHVEYLRKAKALGDHLTVGVLSDEWAASFKKKPILTQAERARVIESCRFVDAVLLQPEPVSAEWLTENGFALNVIAFGNEQDKLRHLQTTEGYDRSREVELAYEQGISTTDILKRVEQRVVARQNETATIQKAFAPRWHAHEWLLAEQMLGDIQQIFAAHGISWFLTYGSLLGAIRHDGVIPWDDDIDIAIFALDEEKLKALVPALTLAGYGLGEYRKPHAEGIELFYKVWMRGRPIVRTGPHSWPFVDIFVLRPSDEQSIWQIGFERFPSAAFLPLKQRPFGNMNLPVPADNNLLFTMYGPDALTTCISTNYVHRYERDIRKITRPALQVKEAGCFVPVHQLAGDLWNWAPKPRPDWHLAENDILVRQGESKGVNLDEPLAALWRQIHRGATFGELVEQIGGLRGDAIQIVTDNLRQFQKLHAIAPWEKAALLDLKVPAGLMAAGLTSIDFKAPAAASGTLPISGSG